MTSNDKKVEYLVVDTTAFIQNAALHEIAEHIITCQDVINEVTDQRQLKRLIALPYNLIVKDVFPENIKVLTDFSKKTGDYPSLSATDIKVMALTYQLEKEKVGAEHLRTVPVLPKPTISTEPIHDLNPDITGFFKPGQQKEDAEELNNESDDEAHEITSGKADKALVEKFGTLNCKEDDLDKEADEDILVPVEEYDDVENSSNSSERESDDDDNAGWITPANVKIAKKQVNSKLMEEKHVKVACMTTDFAMQNVLRQMNLNVAALDGRMIKHLRTYILRCYTCFKTTSIMTKKFCPKCGNSTLKKVGVSVDGNGETHLHINHKKPLTGRGKKFSLPRIQGGKHPNNPILVADQPMADNKPSRLAKAKNDPLDDNYIAGFSPFIMRDVNSKSAQLGIRPGAEFKQWMKKNPNESRRRRK